MKTTHFLLTLHVCSAALWAQSVAGSGVAGGRVFDHQGVGMPDAAITLDNPALGITRHVESSVDGLFEVTGLIPGPGYRLSITHRRFVAWQSEEFDVQVGRRAFFTITMRPENAAADLEIEPPPVADPSNPSMGASFGGLALDTLPTQARRWTGLALFSPIQRSAAPFSLLYLDGLVSSNLYRASPESRLPHDAIEGVEVLSAAAPVEFSHSSGAILNAVTRSGATQLHGGVYDYFSNDSLNALGRYALGHQLAGRRQQGGFHLGGRIPASRLFFFSNLELLDARGQGLNRISNPLLISATCKATTAQCAAATSLFRNQMDVLVPSFDHSVSGVFKLDYRRSDRSSFSLSGNAAQTEQPLGGAPGAVSSNNGLLGGALLRQDTRSGRFEWTSAPTPVSINELRLGLFHDRISSGQSSTGLATQRTGVNLLGTQIGETYPDSSVIRQRRLQLVDHLRANLGAHSILIGVDWTRTQDRVDSLPNSAGTYYYTSLTSFAQDLASTTGKNYAYYTQTRGVALRKLNTPALGFYVQDSWSATDRLRVTAGLRWNKQFLPQPTEYHTTYYNTAHINSSNFNVDPRIGISYLLDRRTVVRGSFAIQHADHPGELIDALFVGNTKYQTSVLTPPTLTYAPAFRAAYGSTSVLPTGSINVMYANTKLRNPYTQQTSFEIERTMAGLVLTLSYTGIRGAKLYTADDVNLGTRVNVTYNIKDAGGASAGTYNAVLFTSRSNTNVAHVYEINNGGASSYRAGSFAVRKPLSHGLTANASYTWSHSIDDVSGSTADGGAALATVPLNRGVDRGDSTFDQRHRLVFDFAWQPRPWASNSLLARTLVNGWQLSSISSLATGTASTPLVYTIGQQFSAYSTTAFPASLDGSGGWARVPFLRSGSYRLDPQYTVNARLARPIPITERISAALSFEAFNLLNRQYDTSVNTLAYTAVAGTLTPVSGAGLGNQARGSISSSNARSCQIGLRFNF